MNKLTRYAAEQDETIIRDDSDEEGEELELGYEVVFSWHW